jgi:glycerol-1-phosphate dehydrogenase [NAD(P)+]
MQMHVMELPRLVVVGEEIISKSGELLKELELGANALVISGPNVKAMLSKQLELTLAHSKFSSSWEIVGNSTFQEVERVAQLAQSINASYLIGVGGGKSIDIAKLASFQSKIPFISIPTSASHDGISSPFGSVKGMDRPYSIVAKPPLAIVADTSVISRAPKKFMISGCGDLISKKTAVKDWELAHEKRGEYFGGYSASLAELSANLIMDNARIIGSSDNESYRLVVEALISSGVAAGIAGSSRPCSGSEHLFSHALDIIAPGKGMHGEKCGIGTIMMAKLHGLDFEKIIDSLSVIGAPTKAFQIGVTEEQVVKALVIARTIRKERFTILDDVKLTESSALELAKSAKVV